MQLTEKERKKKKKEERRGAKEVSELQFEERVKEMDGCINGKDFNENNGGGKQERVQEAKKKERIKSAEWLLYEKSKDKIETW